MTPEGGSGAPRSQPARRGGQSAVAVGRRAERAAADHLAAQGYRLEAANRRTPAGELDLVAWDGDILVFVEVKARAGIRHGRPEEAVDRAKRARLIGAAEAFLAARAEPTPVCRFDVVAVELGQNPPRLAHIKDAFRLGD